MMYPQSVGPPYTDGRVASTYFFITDPWGVHFLYVDDRLLCIIHVERGGLGVRIF
jgi:hypothetical protein